MMSFRCRKHRNDPFQRLWQVATTEDGLRAARRVEGAIAGSGQKPSGWIEEKRSLVPGLYCQVCLEEGSVEPLPDYDERDLRDAGLLDRPHIGLSASNFEATNVWDALNQSVGRAVVAIRNREPRPGRTDSKLRADTRLTVGMRAALTANLRGGDLYTHQVQAIDAALSGHDVAIETATASGKSLCYWVPVLNEASKDSDATALYLAPLNALVEDQLEAVERLCNGSASVGHLGTPKQFVRTARLDQRGIVVARYDGSIKDQEVRRSIRFSGPQVLITNPDMLHHGILPHHGRSWKRLFSNLRFLVLDEMHVYKGMFGAHVANIVRRVLRVAEHYGMRPQVIGCSASIGNPIDLFTALTSRKDAVLVRAADSGAPVRAQKRIVLDLARTKESMPTLAKDLLVELIGKHRARTIAFMRSIPEVDQVFRYVSGDLARHVKGLSKTTVRQYKREIPPQEKATVTADLKSGATLGVISTTALQLGIDIGDLSVCLVCKFPGSKAAFMQQAGRVGRSGESLVLFVADESPLDQHYARRPDELLAGPPEVVYLNPQHFETALHHLRCAAEELPINPAEDRKYWPEIDVLVAELAKQPGMKPNGREVLVLDRVGAAASEVNIRSLGFECVVRDEGGDEVAVPDVLRAVRRFHKYARFQIQDQSFEVTRLSLNWLDKRAEATARRLDRLDYTTVSVVKTECSIIREEENRALSGDISFSRGDVRLTVHVDGYYKIKPGGGDPEYQHLGLAAPPEHELDTEGLWLTVPLASLHRIAPTDHLPSITSAIEAMRIAAALLCSTDPEDIGVHVEEGADNKGSFRMFLADSGAGGDGLTEQVYRKSQDLVGGALRVLRDCPHCTAEPGSRGCGQCITTQWGSSNDVCRDGGILILSTIEAGLLGDLQT